MNSRRNRRALSRARRASSPPVHCEQPTGRANARPMTGSATKQSSLACFLCSMDCFAVLAMTVLRPLAETLIQHPPAVGTVEREGRHLDLESLAALAHHLVADGHEARRGRQRHAAGVFVALARREHRLLADHAFAADFLLPARGVS